MTANPPAVIIAAVFDAKPYDREALQQASANRGIEWQFLEFRLMQGTAFAAKNARVGADYFTSGIPDTQRRGRNRPHYCGQHLGPGQPKVIRQRFGSDLN